MLKLVLISGKAESGKDTVAKIIENKVNNKFAVITPHIADKVKSIAKEDFGWDGIKDEKGRALLQLIGDGGRQYNPNIWVNHFLRFLHFSKALNNSKGVKALILIPDVRYKNEVIKLVEWGNENEIQVFKVRVERPNYTNKLTEEQRKNSSETDLDNCEFWDFKVINDSTLENLYKTVDKMLEVMEIGYKS